MCCADVCIQTLRAWKSVCYTMFSRLLKVALTITVNHCAESRELNLATTFLPEPYSTNTVTM